MSNKTSLLDQKRIEALLKQGLRHGIIARRIGCHRRTVWRIAKRLDIRNHRPGRPRLTESF